MNGDDITTMNRARRGEYRNQEKTWERFTMQAATAETIGALVSVSSAGRSRKKKSSIVDVGRNRTKDRRREGEKYSIEETEDRSFIALSKEGGGPDKKKVLKGSRGIAQEITNELNKKENNNASQHGNDDASMISSGELVDSSANERAETRNKQRLNQFKQKRRESTQRNKRSEHRHEQEEGERK